VGADASQLSRPVPSGAVVGALSPALCAELGISRGAKLVAGGHDQSCAALGAGIIRENVALDSHGTAEAVSTAFKEPRTDDVMFDSYYPCYRHTVKGMYLTFGLNHTAGILMKWYHDTLGLAEVQEAQRLGERPFEQIAKTAVAGPSPLLVLPHFNGSGTPTCDVDSKGAILGLTMSTTRHDISKGFMDATAFELRNNLETLARAGIPIRDLLCVGGGARSPIDLQLKADVTGLPVSTLKIREAACLGASILAGMGAGAFSDVQEAAGCVKIDRTYEPDEKMHARYNEKYSIYKELYDTLKDINHKQRSW
jgi:xylulokinase